jgi:hypothetical protein
MTETPRHLRESKLTRLYWEDFEVGDVLEAPWGRTITDAYLLAFAGANSDSQHMHVDEVYSQTTEFGGRIAHGNLTAIQGLGMQVYTQVFHHAVRSSRSATSIAARSGWATPSTPRWRSSTHARRRRKIAGSSSSGTTSRIRIASSCASRITR